MNALSLMQQHSARGKKIITSALIINEHGEFLALLRDDDKSNGGTWGIPGGKKEAGESLESSVRREINEETGLSAIAVQPLMKTDTTERVFYDYIALVRKSDVALNGEHTDYKWISSPDEWPQPAHPVTAKLLQDKRPQIMAFVTKTPDQPRYEF